MHPMPLALRSLCVAVLLMIAAVTGFLATACCAQEVTRFDPRKAELRGEGDHWKIVAGDVTIKCFYEQAAAREALAVIRFYGMDSRLSLGSIEIFLVGDRAPAGEMKGEKAIPIDKIEVLRVPATLGIVWKVIVGDDWVLDVEDDENQARQAAALIQKYRFTRLCYVGSRDKEMVYFRVDGPPPAAPAVPPSPVSPAAATAYDLYFLAGQSNMDGRGKAADLTEAQRKPFENAVIFYRYPPASSEQFKPLAPGYSMAPGYKGGLPSSTFGPEIGFALAMTRAAPAAHLALIKGSKGGTSLAKDWAPGVKGKPDTQGPCYRNFIETVALAIAQLKRDGHTFTPRGLLWHQGEGDASSTTEMYQQRLAEFIARMREDLGTPDLPVVVGEVFDNGKRDTVRAALRAAPGKVPHVGFASAEGLKTWDNGTHFDAAGQITLGERFAEAMLKLISPTK